MMAKTCSVEEAAGATVHMSSPGEFDESIDSMEYVSEDSSWDKAANSSEIDENEEIDVS